MNKEIENNGTKQCPYCGETIMASAVKCSYCGEWLEETEKGDPKEKSTVQPSTNDLKIASITGRFHLSDFCVSFGVMLFACIISSLIQYIIESSKIKFFFSYDFMLLIVITVNIAILFFSCMFAGSLLESMIRKRYLKRNSVVERVRNIWNANEIR